MKKTYFSLIIALFIQLIPLVSVAQWIPVYIDNNAQFYDAAFPTETRGYVAASDSAGALVLRTTDGGLTWNKKYIQGLGHLDKVVMTDSVNGYLIRGGAPGFLMKTSNGFDTYMSRVIDSSFIVQSLAVLNDSTGFYLNNAARLRKFEHYGTTFTHIIDSLIDGQNMQFVNVQTAYLDNGNRLLRSADTGMSWNVINNNMGFSSVVFNFSDSAKGYFSDGSMIYKTNDGGLTFLQSFNFQNVYSFAVQNNFCIAANDTGAVAFSTNGGVNWQTESTGIFVQAPAPYKVVCTPGGRCFLFSQFCGEIRKRESLIAGISEEVEDNSFGIYPNPATDQFTLVLSELPDQASITVYNMTGQSVKIIANILEQKTLVPCAELTAGIYFVQLQQAGQAIQTIKLLISK